MNRAVLFEIKIFWFPMTAFPLGGDEHKVDSINRYARDVEHARAIGRKFSRETLKAGEILKIETRELKL